MANMDKTMSFRREDSLRDITCYIIKCLQGAISSSEPLSESQTHKLFDKIAERFISTPPYSFIASNLITLLKKHMRMKIEDDNQQPIIKKKNKPNLMELFADLSLGTQTSQQNTSKEDPRWIKIMTLELLDDLKTDIKMSTEPVIDCLATRIKENSVVIVFQPDQQTVDALTRTQSNTPFQLNIVTAQTTKVKCSPLQHIIPLKHSSSIIKKADLVIIPCLAILKHGAAVSLSGSLLLAMTAKSLSVPVIVFGISHSLTSKNCFQPNSLSFPENPNMYFGTAGNRQYGQTFISKRFDCIPAKYIELLVTDIGEATPSYAYKLFEKHYQ